MVMYYHPFNLVCNKIVTSVCGFLFGGKYEKEKNIT